MRSCLARVSFAVLLLVLGCREAPPIALPARIAVLPFEAGEGVSSLHIELHTWVSDLMAGAPRVQLVRVLPDRMPGKPRRLRKGEKPPPALWEVGRDAGADVVIAGKVLETAGKLRCEITLYAATDGKVLGKLEALGREDDPLGMYTRVHKEVASLLDAPLPPVPTKHGLALRQLVRGLAHQFGGFPADAKNAFESALRVDPQFFRASVELIHVLADIGLRAEALQLLLDHKNRHRKLDPVSAARLDLLTTRLAGDDVLALERAAGALRDLAPSDRHALLLGARAALVGRFDLAEARKLLERVTAAYPGDGNARIELVHVLMVSGQDDRARRLLDQVPESSETASIIDARALVSATRGDLARATDQYGIAIGFGYRASRLGHLWTSLLAGEVEQGELDVEELDQQSPLRATAAALLSAACGRCKGALAATDRLAQQAGEDRAMQLASQVLRARVALGCGQPGTAKSELAGLLVGKPPTSRAVFSAMTLLGLAALEDKDDGVFRAARAWLQGASGARTAPLLALLDGEQALAAGKPALALEQARRAAEIVVEPAVSLLTRALEALGQHEECAKEGTRIVPDTQWPGQLGGFELATRRWLSGARCLEALGRPEQAAKVYGRIARLQERADDQTVGRLVRSKLGRAEQDKPGRKRRASDGRKSRPAG